MDKLSINCPYCDKLADIPFDEGYVCGSCYEFQDMINAATGARVPNNEYPTYHFYHYHISGYRLLEFLKTVNNRYYFYYIFTDKKTNKSKYELKISSSPYDNYNSITIISNDIVMDTSNPKDVLQKLHKIAKMKNFQ